MEASAVLQQEEEQRPRPCSVSFKPVTDETLEEIRDTFFEKYIKKIEQGDYDNTDLARLKKDLNWVKAFFYNSFRDTQRAVDLIDESLSWRKNFQASELVSSDSLPCSEELIRQGTFFKRNKDKFGNSILHIVVKTHKKDRFPHEQICKLVAYWFERGYTFGNGESLCICFDNADAGYSNSDLDLLKFVIACIKTYYPSSSYKILVYKMPFALLALWKIIKTILPTKAVDIIKFVDEKSIKEYVDDDNLFVHMGGKDTFKFDPNDPNLLDCLRKGTF